MILRREAGVCQEAIDVAPFSQSPIIEHFQLVCNDKGDDVVCQTFLKHQQASYSAIAILKRMNLLELHMEVENIFE